MLLLKVGSASSPKCLSVGIIMQWKYGKRRRSTQNQELGKRLVAIWVKKGIRREKDDMGDSDRLTETVFNFFSHRCST